MSGSLKRKLEFRVSQMQKKMEIHELPEAALTYTLAAMYVLSGVTQPLLMTLAKQAGLADSTCQVYMLFYYVGPASVTVYLLAIGSEWPSRGPVLRCAGIACFDLFAQALNYTGAALAGPTLFSIIYSAVTVWTAIFSWLILTRRMTPLQWLGVFTVFGGLTITGLDSVSLGPEVFHGSSLVMFGSIMHALTYVMSEAIMVGDEPMSYPMNCAIQGNVALVAMLIWQVVYTMPRYEELIDRPMKEAGTTVWYALGVMMAFALANFLHSIGFFHTLRHFAGGATSAGVMKGLQAVLVFVVTSWAYCGRLGGQEMCFSHVKLLSLLIVVSGVLVFGTATEMARTKGYERLQDNAAVEVV